MTRTLLIKAYYYYFTNRYENNDDPCKWDNFEFLFKEMKAQLDIYLEKAGYQLFNSKMLFDILMTFSAWAYFNNL